MSVILRIPFVQAYFYSKIFTFLPSLLALLAGGTYTQSIIIDKLFVGKGFTIEGADEGCRSREKKIIHFVFVLDYCDSAPL